MKRSRFSEEQIIGILREQEAGQRTADVCHRRGISEGTFYKWKAKYGGLEVSEAKRLKSLEDENARLQMLLAEAMPDNAMLKNAAASVVGPRGRCDQSQEAPAPLRARRPAGTQARWPQTGLGHAGTDVLAVCPEPALVVGLCLGCLHRWPPVAHSCHRRWLHARMSGAGGRYAAFGATGRPGTGRADPATPCKAFDRRQRQWDRTDQHGDPQAVSGSADRMALHDSWETDAERPGRELHV